MVAAAQPVGVWPLPQPAGLAPPRLRGVCVAVAGRAGARGSSVVGMALVRAGQGVTHAATSPSCGREPCREVVVGRGPFWG